MKRIITPLLVLAAMVLAPYAGVCAALGANPLICGYHWHLYWTVAGPIPILLPF